MSEYDEIAALDPTLRLTTRLLMQRAVQAQRIAELEAALRPFATFGANNVDEDGWSGREQRASIHTWFGPSEFRAARDALGTLPDVD